MSVATHIIYISGFGDGYDSVRRRLLSKWRYDGVTVELLPMSWKSDETFEQKMTRIERVIDHATGTRIVLIGESASGSMVVHAYARRSADIAKVITICGKNAQPQNVMPRYYAKYPVFRDSMDRLDESIARLDDTARRRFVSIHPLYDPVVSVRDMLLPGCREVTIWAMGHLFVIFLILTVWSGKVIREAKT